MTPESLDNIQKLLMELSAKPDAAITAAYITVGGMLGVAILGAITQLLLTKFVLKSEYQKIHRQLSSEFRLRQYELWQIRFQDTMVELLKATDPECNSSFSPANITPLIHKAQLMLNLRDPKHARINGYVNDLGLAVNGWHGRTDRASLLRVHAALLEAAREVLFLPGK